MMKRGAGGTPGGLTEFFLGTAMVMLGGIVFLQRLMVSSSIPTLWGIGGSGVALLVLLIGIGIVFFSGRAKLGWIMIVVGGLWIMYSVITNLVVYFMPTSLLQTILMLGLVFGGLGLIARALRPH
jgi:hypothetical protein